MKKFKVGIIGATGMVGQRFVTLLENHPWFEISCLAASPRSAGRSYKTALNYRWSMTTPLNDKIADMTVLNVDDIKTIRNSVDFVFSAVDMPKADIIKMEETFAKAEIPVVSNNSACRNMEDVPMVIPELNPEHLAVIETQRKRLGTRIGFIAVKSNCSIQSYVPALHPLRVFGIKNVLACTYQAISGAGKTFSAWPEMVDNLIPFIGGEEDKSEKEPMKIWGTLENGVIVNANTPNITTQCLRVPVSDGHTAAVFVSFENKPTKDQILTLWEQFSPESTKLALPLAPAKFLRYFKENDRPQIKLDRDTDKGMSISVGRLREDTQYDYKFVCLSHNTVRGAAGGAILLAELLAKKGYFS
jgi:aspartate-semialdehyde dehydrogenase